MDSEPEIWWYKIGKRLFVVLGIFVPFIMLLAIVLAIAWWGWGWTGIGPYFAPPQTKVTDLPRGRTLWDWLNLLIVPLMLRIGGFWLNTLDKNRDKINAEQREKTDREMTLDNQREVAFQAYLEKMAELLLEKGLRDSHEDDEVRKIARARTLTALRILDAKRRAHVLRGLHDFGLISKGRCIIGLNGISFGGAQFHEVDLSKDDLSGAYLRETDLSRANLNGASLWKAHLNGANLSEAHLNGASLREANLHGADLSGASLRKADCSKADLSEAHFILADLSRANLEGALGITVEELKKQAASLQGAIMPDGSIYS